MQQTISSRNQPNRVDTRISLKMIGRFAWQCSGSQRRLYIRQRPSHCRVEIPRFNLIEHERESNQMQTFQQPTSFQNYTDTMDDYENPHRPFYPNTAPPRYEDVTSESSTSIEPPSTTRLEPQDIQEVDKTLSWIPPPPSQNLTRSPLSVLVIVLPSQIPLTIL